jgi:DNA-binding MarR family transcriptional regulator
VGSGVTRLYTYIPLDFDQALKDGRLRAFDYALGCHLACESYRDLNSNRGIVTAYVSALADVFEVDRSTIRRALRRLRAAGWIDFPEPDERQRAPWPITLTGLAREAQRKGTAAPSAALQLRHVPQRTAAEVELREDAESLRERDYAASPLRPSRARANETKRNEENLLGEEKLDHAQSKTTATDPDRGVTDRLLAQMAELDRRQRDEGPPVHVEQADDGSLVWCGDPQAGEQGLLDDLQALVDAGLGEWRENDDGGER